MLAAESLVNQMAAAEPWPENAAFYQPLRGEQILVSDAASCLAVQAFLRMCSLPVYVVYRPNAEQMSPSGKVPFIHVGNHVVSELGPIVQFVKAKGHCLSSSLDEQQKAEMKAYMELVNNVLLTAENWFTKSVGNRVQRDLILYILWCDDTTCKEISRPRYGSPYPWPLNRLLAYQKQWEVRRKMKALSWASKTPEQVHDEVNQCLRALSLRLGSQSYFFGRQPTELDALVFGHLFTLLTTELSSDTLPELVRAYPNLADLCQRVERQYFREPGDETTVSTEGSTSSA